MAKDLYLKLMSGETVHVTDSWDGAAPTEEGMVDADGVAVDANGKEVSEAYRDIHRYNAQVWPAQGSLTVTGTPSDFQIGSTSSAPVTVQAALVPSTTVQAQTIAGTYSSTVGLSIAATTKGLVPDSVTAEPSDEVVHKKPRQFAKVYTWLIFSEDPSGPVHKWRKSEVMGWGCMAPIDI